MQTTVPLSEFEPKASHYVLQVGKTGQELTITDHGNPVVKLIPVAASSNQSMEDPEEILQSLRGSVIEYIDPLEPVRLEDWEVLK